MTLFICFIVPSVLLRRMCGLFYEYRNKKRMKYIDELMRILPNCRLCSSKMVYERGVYNCPSLNILTHFITYTGIDGRIIDMYMRAGRTFHFVRVNNFSHPWIETNKNRKLTDKDVKELFLIKL